MTDRFKNALDGLNKVECGDDVLNWFDDNKTILKEALTLATESEQLRKERDELAAYIRQKHDVLEVPTEIFNLCIQNR